ncbi:MAG TPA: ferritin family protein [Oscillospiraceae bacterium]|nr:ferritin family protein [Oscillospiraceae bacterium]
MNIDDYRKIIATAIEFEIESYEFYQGVAEKTTDNNIKAIFASFATEELAHKNFLEDFLQGDARSLAIKTQPDYKVADTVAMPKLTVEMQPAEAIALAMKKEEEAMKMYTSLANHADSPEHKKLFADLAAMEKNHKVELENIYVSTAFPEVW